MDNQKNRRPDIHSRHSALSELRSPVQPVVCIQNIDVVDTVIINEDCTGEDYKHFVLRSQQNCRMFVYSILK